MAGWMSLGLFFAIGLALMAGFPVAFTLAGVGLLFAGFGVLTGTFDPVFLEGMQPDRANRFNIFATKNLIFIF